MSLDIEFYDENDEVVYEGNITHNCVDVASALGIYGCLWHLEGVKRAGDMIGPLTKACEKLEGPLSKQFEAYEPSNGWGTNYQFLCFLEGVVRAAHAHPDADVDVYR